MSTSRDQMKSTIDSPEATTFSNPTMDNNKVFASEVITAVTSGAAVGVSMMPVSILTRKLQLNAEKRLGNSLHTSVATRPSHASKTSVLFTFGNSIARAMQVGATKNSVITQRDKISNLVAGENDKPAPSSQENDSASEGRTALAKEQAKQPLTIGEILAAASIVTAVDSLVMNPYSNKQIWHINSILNKFFVEPRPSSWEQKFHASTTGIMMRFLKGMPSVAGLIAQENIKHMLPDSLHEEKKAFITAGIVGAMITPLITSSDNLHSLQLASVNAKTSKTLSISNILAKYGLNAIKPTLATTTATFFGQATLQFVIPQATSIIEEYVTPKIIKAGGSFLNMIKPTLKHNIEQRDDEHRNPNPFENNGF